MSVVQDLPGFGVQIANYTFKNDLDWLVKLNDPREIFLAQPTLVATEYLFYFLAVLTLFHSLIVGGRWKYFWFGAFLCGVCAELSAIFLSTSASDWYSQTSVMLLGRKLPLHIVFAYTICFYVASYATSHMKLSNCVSSMAAGLVGVLMVLPYEIVGLKFLHWTWSDTNPIYAERHYWTPWTVYSFILLIGISFNFFVKFLRKRLTGTAGSTTGKGMFKELLSVLLAAPFGCAGGLFLLLILYHPLHDILKMSSEMCCVLLVVFCLLMVWKADRRAPDGSRKHNHEKAHWSAHLLFFCIILYYGFCLALSVFGFPEREVSMGLHERTGPCNAYTDVELPYGQKLRARQFLCTKDYTQKYYDFHCLESPPKNGVEWYTICGTPFENRPEYITYLSALLLFALIIYKNLLYKSSSTLKVRTYSKPQPSKVDHKKVKKH